MTIPPSRPCLRHDRCAQRKARAAQPGQEPRAAPDLIRGEHGEDPPLAGASTAIGFRQSGCGLSLDTHDQGGLKLPTYTRVTAVPPVGTSQRSPCVELPEGNGLWSSPGAARSGWGVGVIDGVAGTALSTQTTDCSLGLALAAPSAQPSSPPFQMPPGAKKLRAECQMLSSLTILGSELFFPINSPILK